MANWKDHINRARNTAQKLADGIKRKNRNAAAMNRLRTVIRCQEQAAEKEYMALGRYYYNALRDSDNPVAEEHCQRLDEINALLDSTLKTLEESVRDNEAASIGTISGADGTIFHFGRGPLEITVTRDVVYRPEDEDSVEIEEIDLSDVESFDHDPMPEESVPPAAAGTLDVPDGENSEPNDTESEPDAAEPEFAGAEPEFSGAELDENDGLPFEG